MPLNVIGCFMKLEKEDHFAALSYLAQWDYGEDIGEERDSETSVMP